MLDLHAYARDAARRNDVDPDTFEKQIQQESGFNPDAHNDGSDADGIAQIVARWHPTMVGRTRDPLASLDYAAQYLAQLRQQFGSYRTALAAYNWGPGNVSHWDGNRGSLPPETQHYLDVILGPGWPEPDGSGSAPTTEEPATVVSNSTLHVADGPARLRSAPGTGAAILAELPVGTALVDVGDDLVDADGHRWRRVAVGPVGYIADELLAGADTIGPIAQPARYVFNPTTATELQVQDWTCSIRSTMWLLKSIGIAVTPAEAQDAMSPEYVSSADGLLDASGAGIVAVLRDRWGIEAVNRSPVSFDEVASWAGHQPVAIGGRNWGGPNKGHWSAVKGFDGERLILANPGGTGPIYGQQTLTRQQFADKGWFSAVTIPV